MNTTPPPTVVTAPDLAKGLSGLKGSLSEGLALDPVSAVIEGMASANGIVGFIIAVCYWIARGAALPFELCLRTRIGARYISPPVLIAFGAVLGMIRFSNNLSSLVSDDYNYNHPHPGAIPEFFLVVTFIGLFLHGREVHEAQKEGIYWHSYSDGESRLHMQFLQDFWRKRRGTFSTIDVAKNILEPLVPAFLALFCFSLPVLSAYFALAALSMFAYQYFGALALRGKLFDHLDNQLMLEAQEESLKPEQTPGLKAYRGAAYIPVTTPQIWQTQHSPLPTEGVQNGGTARGSNQSAS